MKAEHYPFVIRPLPYEYDALSPVLDEQTLYVHHDKHYKTYVDNLNAILSNYPQLQQLSLEVGQVRVDGTVQSRTYEEPAASGGFFARLFG